jgi:glycosyltransferase involved in cell wall biosynthesis
MHNLKKTRILVYALCDVYYYSYYLFGIKKIFKNYSFNIEKFPRFSQGVCAIIIEDGTSIRKIIIDSDDSSDYNIDALNWCDVYAKVNYNLNKIDKKNQFKIIPIGPSFAIKYLNLFESIFIPAYLYVKFNKFIVNKREFFSNYYRQYMRLPISDYENKLESTWNYVFSVSSIWKKEFFTNKARASFFECCKHNPKINFEGGFSPRNDGENLGYDNLLIKKRINFKEYIFKTKKSSFVFNTPAVLSCHGWKLAEYLAMGKAIISTNHINSFHDDLVDKLHLIYVDDLEKLNDRINYLIENKEFKTNLEKNAKNYYLKNLEPIAVVYRIFGVIQ